MRKIILILALTFFGFSSIYAGTPGATSNTCTTPSAAPGGVCYMTNCSNPNTTFTDQTNFKCGYSDDVYTGDRTKICSWIYNGGDYTQHSVNSCTFNPAKAPINSGLIFLVIAGGGLGAYMFKKYADKSKNGIAI